MGAIAAAGTAFAGTAPAPTPARPHAVKQVRTARVSADRLAVVHIPRKVLANGEPLAAGTYVLVLSKDAPTVEGENPASERWVEFQQRGQVKGREIASVIPADKISEVAKDPNRPKPGRARVEMLKGGEYLRVWVNKGGDNYLVHLVVPK
ncbi:MAG TPA: hypothetical protein VNE16_03405 [Vicinamibacterales bacterium]|nr:hypothetical protein [Vicinamibacterales bacterium]